MLDKEDSFNADNSDYEEEKINPKVHKRFLNDVTSLQKSQFISKATRNEPALKRNEFSLAKPSERVKDTKVNVHDLAKILDKTSKHLNLSKQLKKTIKEKKVLPKPLEKIAADKLQRVINYEKAVDKLDRWDAVVSQNRSTDHVSFPLNQEVDEITIKDSFQTPANFRIKSEMMQEMEKVEPEIFQIGKIKDEDEDELIKKQLTRGEMIERSRELRYLRIKESQKSAKARMRNKIKSKTYHRIMKKEKLRQHLKEFEQLQKTDPEAALKKIEQLDRSRVEERANLRHRNTGTWAKNLQVRAKYDKDVRQELADQIRISRELTAKKPTEESESDDNENAVVGDEDHDPFNPWLKNGGAQKSESLNDQLLGGYKKYWTERNKNESKWKEYQRDDDESMKVEEVRPPTSQGTVATTWTVSEAHIKTENRKSSGKMEWIEEDISDDTVKERKKKRPKNQKKNQVEVLDDLDDLFDNAEDQINARLARKLKRMKQDITWLSKKTKPERQQAKVTNERIDLSFKSQKKVPLIDEDLIEDSIEKEKLKVGNVLKSVLKNGERATSTATSADSENINVDNVATMKPRSLQTALPDTIYTDGAEGFYNFDDAEYHFEEQKKLTIAEAFGDDDIVAEFQHEKQEEQNKDQPQEIDLSMPGWGSWCGVGIDASKKKARRIVIKPPPAEKRRPESQGNVVIIENRDAALQKHLVSDLPFPFTKVYEYEQSIRAPVGSDFVPATAHRLLTKPAVTTKSGTIIEPMTERMLVKKPKKPNTKTSRRIEKLNEAK